MKKSLTTFESAAIAAKAKIDPRTMRRYLAGAPVRETCRLRIVEATAMIAREQRAKEEG
jgi:hypothetical protein